MYQKQTLHKNCKYYRQNNIAQQNKITVTQIGLKNLEYLNDNYEDNKNMEIIGQQKYPKIRRQKVCNSVSLNRGISTYVNKTQSRGQVIRSLHVKSLAKTVNKIERLKQKPAILSPISNNCSRNSIKEQQWTSNEVDQCKKSIDRILNEWQGIKSIQKNRTKKRLKQIYANKYPIIQHKQNIKNKRSNSIYWLQRISNNSKQSNQNHHHCLGKKNKRCFQLIKIVH